MTAYPNTLSEINIGGVTLPNRIVRTAHVTMLGIDDPTGMGERLIAYHEARARGGVGLSILEICSVHPSSWAPLMAFNPALVEGYRRLVDRVKPHGMRLFQQIWHGGHNMRPAEGSVPWSASDIPGPKMGIPARPMTKSMIDEVIEGFVLAARKAKEGGIDGVELHAAHGYLFQQFLSPLTNKREDDYGGPLENRTRLLVEALTAVRSEVGEGYPVGVRVGPQMVDGGFGVEDCITLVKTLESKGLTDFVDISQGSYFNEVKIVAPMHEPVGYQMDCSIPIAEAANSPTIVTGRFRTLEEAEQVIRLGQADCVSMCRATIADPDLVNKSVEGKDSEVRPCIGCNQACIGRMVPGKAQFGLSCTVNPAVGIEAQISETVIAPCEKKKHVLVVGGGPAGMEAARVAALRGHKVTLCEAQKDLGGKLNLAKLAPYRASIGDIGTWLESEVFRLGVEVKLSTYIDVDNIAAYAPDTVIYATGTLPRYDGFHLGCPGSPLAEGNQDPLTSFDVILQTPDPEHGPFVVEDDVGHYEGIAVAEFLLQSGAEVIFVTRHASLAPLMEPTFSAEPAFARLSAYDRFRLFTRSSIAKFSSDSIDIKTGDSEAVSIQAGAVVLVTLESPSYELLEQTQEKGIDCQVIGDACSPRFLETAILEGRSAGICV